MADSNKGVTARKARKIAHEVLSMHIKYPAPKGHKGLERVMARDKRRSHFMKTGK